MKMKMFSIGDKEQMVKMDSILLQETQMTSQERHCRKEGNLKIMMDTVVHAMKEWLRLLQMMDKVDHLKDTAHSMEKLKKFSTKNKLKRETISKSSRFSNLSPGLTIITTANMMEMQM